MKAKKVMITIIVALSLCSGCLDLDNIEQGYFEKLTQAVNVGIDAQQTSNRAVIDAVRASGTVSHGKLDEITEKVVKIDEYVDIAQAAATEAAIAYEEKRAEDPVMAIIEAATKANEISAGINPYSSLIDIGLAMAAALAVAYAGMKNKQLSKVSKKYKIHKEVVNQIIVDSEPEKAQELYDKIGIKREEAGL